MSGTGKRLTKAQRKLMGVGLALVVRCEACDDEHFLATLPLDMREMVRITRRFKCPNDKSHRVLVGPIPAGRLALEEADG